MMAMQVPMAQGQVTGAVAMMLNKPATRRKTTRKRRAAATRTKRKTAAPKRRAKTNGRLKKGSPAAKRRMAKLRAMKARKR